MFAFSDESGRKDHILSSKAAASPGFWSISVHPGCPRTFDCLFLCFLTCYIYNLVLMFAIVCSGKLSKSGIFTVRLTVRLTPPYGQSD